MNKFVTVDKVEELKKYSSPYLAKRRAKELGYDNIYISPLKTKKFMIITPEGKKVHFGYMGMEDYLKHRNSIRRDNFRQRNAKWATQDKYTAGRMSYDILW
jgi:hypothetical protein